jgi:hypothetical protein
LEWLLASLFVDFLRLTMVQLQDALFQIGSMQEKNSIKEGTHLNLYVKTKRELKSAPC